MARKLALAAAAAVVIGVVAVGALPHLAPSAGAGDADDPAGQVASAVVAVTAGEMAGCANLEAALRTDRSLQERVEGAREAAGTCVDQAIEAALAQPEPLARERALLAVAAADASLTPTVPQFQRIAREVAAIPGAEQQGAGRVRVRSYEIRGPLPIPTLRAHTRDQLIRLRGCHAQAWQEGRGHDEAITLKVSVDGGGRVTGVGADGLDARLLSCLEAAFVGAELGGTTAASRATIVLDLEPS